MTMGYLEIHYEQNVPTVYLPVSDWGMENSCPI